MAKSSGESLGEGVDRGARVLGFSEGPGERSDGEAASRQGFLLPVPVTASGVGPPPRFRPKPANQRRPRPAPPRPGSPPRPAALFRARRAGRKGRGLQASGLWWSSKGFWSKRSSCAEPQMQHPYREIFKPQLVVFPPTFMDHHIVSVVVKSQAWELILAWPMAFGTNFTIWLSVLFLRMEMTIASV